MKILSTCLALLLAPLCASAAVTVSFYTGTDNLAQEIVPGQIYLDNVSGLGVGYASMRNIAHKEVEECDGDSKIGFMRFRYAGDVCQYFWRGSDLGAGDPINTGYETIESWHYTYWMGGGALVDGAQWGSDNYVMMRDESDVMIAVFQFDFDEDTQTVSLIASAIDLDGLTYTAGVAAIQAAAVPEPASVAALRRRRGAG